MEMEMEVKFLVRQRCYTEHHNLFVEKLKKGKDIWERHKIREKEEANPQAMEEDAWCVVTWNEEKQEFSVSNLDAIFRYPDEIHQFHKSGALLYDSKLFYVSGYHRDSYNASAWALDFDKLLEHGQPHWHHYPDVNIPRTLPALIGVADYLYVFGKFMGYDRSIYLSHFGERLCIGGKDDQPTGSSSRSSWEPLPGPPKFLQQDRMFYLPAGYAVYYNCPSFSYTSADDDTTYPVPAHQNLILFQSMLYSHDAHPVICVFSCNSNSWLPSIKLNFPGGHVCRRDPSPDHDRLLVVDGIFIWHLHGFISGYDLLNQKYLGRFFEIPPVQRSPFPDDDGCCRIGDPGMFFARRGDHTLFLFFQDHYSIHTIHCHKFRILKPSQGQPFALRHENYTHLSTESLGSRFLLNVQPL